MLKRTRNFKKYYILPVLSLLLALISSCGSPELLQEQVRVALDTKPTPGINFMPNGQPCVALACTPTANGKGGTGNGAGSGTGSTGVSGAVNTASVYGQHLIDTSNNINLFLTFSYNINDPASVARYYTFVWGADDYQVGAFRSSNPNILLSYYIPFDRDGGTYGHADVAKQHDLNYWRNLHPDWILYKCDRSTPAYIDDNTMPLDITNPAVVDWQVQMFGVPASQNGFDAIGADNVNLENTTGACGFYRNGQWVQRYTGAADDPQWRAGMLGWFTQFQNALHSLPHPLGLIPNLGLNPISPADPFAQQVAAHVDGILDEGGFSMYGQGYLTDNQWLQTINYIKSVQQQGKPYYILNEVGDTGSAQILWNIGSYLMCKERYSSLYISGNQQYGGDKRYPEYTAAIGRPTNEMYSAQNVYWRNYSGGVVVVNPSSGNSYSVNAPAGNYVDVYGNHINQSFTMGPHTGMILLNA